MYKGYYSRQKHSGVYGAFPGGDVSYPTVSPVREEQDALDIIAHQFVREVGTDAAEANSAEFIIEATGHAAQRGDIIRVTSGDYDGREVKVIYVTADLIYISDKIALADTDTFQILRHKAPLVGADGTIPVSASLTQTPIQFDRNGTDTEVKEDTGTPANSRPLPVKVLNGSGAEFISTAAKQDTGNTSLASIDSKITAVNTGAVVVSSSALPSGAATSAKQDTGNTSLASIDSKITAVNTGAVVVSSSALPSGASTSANQTTGNTSLASIDGKITAVNTGAVVVSSSALPTGAATSAKQDTLSAQIPTTLGQKTMANSLAVAIASDQLAVPASQSGTWSVRAQDGSGNALTSEAVGSNRPVHTKPLGSAYADSARNDYSSVNVTTGAWVQLIASTAAEAQGLLLFDSSGQTLELGTGAAASETRKLLIPPGGLNGFIPLRIPSSTRVSVRAVSGTASAGEIDLTLLG